MNLKYLAGIIALLLIPVGVSAAEFIIDEDGTASTKGPVAGDVFIAGNTVSVDEDVEDDIYAAGNTVEIRTSGGGDLTAVGNTVRVTGTFKDDVMAAGNVVTIAAQEADDIFVVGATVELTNAVVATGDVYVAGGVIVIDGQIEGDVRVAGDDVEIASTAVIKGNLTSWGGEEPVIMDGAQITGETTHHVQSYKTPQIDWKFLVAAWLKSVVAWYVVALVLLYVFRGLVEEINNKAQKLTGKSFLVGLVWALIFIPATILIVLTTIGLPLAVLLFLTTLMIGIVAIGATMIVAGDWLMKKGFKRKDKLSWQHALLGAVVVKIVELVPVIGGIVVMAVTLIVMGAVLLTLWQRLRGTTETT